MINYDLPLILGPTSLLILVLIIINAILQASEIILASINEERLDSMREEDPDKRKLLESYMKKKGRYLDNLQAGIVFLNVLITGLVISSYLPLFSYLTRGLGFFGSILLSLVLLSMIIAFILRVFTELVPRRIALKKIKEVPLAYIRISNFLSMILRPFAALVNLFTILVLKISGNYSQDMEEKISEEELRSMIRVGEEQGVINREGKDMIINIFEFDDSSAYEIMTPRTEIYMVSQEDFSVDTISQEILKSGYSRIPVYRDSPDDIVGIVYIKDLFVELSKNKFQSIDLDRVMKKPYFVPESKKIDMLLKELQASKNYMALLIDEYGGLSGMVTVEDIVEEIVGEIEDEYDSSQSEIRKLSQGEFLIEGNTELKTINSRLDLDLDSENHETLGGFIVEHLGFFPEDIDQGPYLVQVQAISLQVLEIEDNRIKKVLLTFLDQEDHEG